jgi:predicted RNase H-like HicB family nuclease
MNYRVIYEHETDEEGRVAWSAYVPDLTGSVVSTGATREECEANILEAIEVYLETMRDEGLPIPDPSNESGRALPLVEDE